MAEGLPYKVHGGDNVTGHLVGPLLDTRSSCTASELNAASCKKGTYDDQQQLSAVFNVASTGKSPSNTGMSVKSGKFASCGGHDIRQPNS